MLTLQKKVRPTTTTRIIHPKDRTQFQPQGKPKKDKLGPTDYQIKYDKTDKRAPNFSFTRSKSNFVDQYVKAHSKVPEPGKYTLDKAYSKISRPISSISRKRI